MNGGKGKCRGCTDSLHIFGYHFVTAVPTIVVSHFIHAELLPSLIALKDLT